MDLCHRSSSDCAGNGGKLQAGAGHRLGVVRRPGEQGKDAGWSCDWTALLFPPLMRDRNEHQGP